MVSAGMTVSGAARACTSGREARAVPAAPPLAAAWLTPGVKARRSRSPCGLFSTASELDDERWVVDWDRFLPGGRAQVDRAGSTHYMQTVLGLEYAHTRSACHPVRAYRR